MKRALRLATLTAVVAAIAPSSASAGIWTPIDSGLPAGATDIIQTIEYQSADRLWYGTSSGKLFTRVGGAMVQKLSAPGVQFLDIAFKPGSPIGIAVGSGGNLWRSANAGDTWTRVNFQAYPTCDTEQNNADIPATTNPNVSLYSVTWGEGGYVFVTGGDQNFLRSADNGASWLEINKHHANQPEPYPTWRKIYCHTDRTAHDLVILPGSFAANAIPLYFLADNGDVHFSSNGLTSAPGERTNLGCSGSTDKQLVVDPVSPARQWATTASTDGCIYRTEDDATYQRVYAENDNGDDLGVMHGIAGAGSPLTLVAVGKGGDILNSVDGQHFYFNRADGSLATTDWHAVDGFDKDNFAVGGVGGALIVTTAASKIPDLTAPTGTIAGPDTVTVNTPAGFTANVADNAGGSGIDTSSFAWTATGTPGATGQTASLTFTGPGTFTVRVTFKDLAGNVGEATKVVTVTAAAPAAAAQPPAPLPVFTFPPASKPPLTGGGARRKGRYVTLRVKGKVPVPKGLAAAQACKGNVFIRVLKGKKLLTARVAKLSATCGYAKKIRVARKKVGRARRLTLVIGFSGNGIVGATERKYTVKVRR